MAQVMFNLARTALVSPAERAASGGDNYYPSLNLPSQGSQRDAGPQLKALHEAILINIYSLLENSLIFFHFNVFYLQVTIE